MTRHRVAIFSRHRFVEIYARIFTRLDQPRNKLKAPGNNLDASKSILLPPSRYVKLPPRTGSSAAQKKELFSQMRTRFCVTRGKKKSIQFFPYLLIQSHFQSCQIYFHFFLEIYRLDVQQSKGSSTRTVLMIYLRRVYLVATFLILLTRSRVYAICPLPWVSYCRRTLTAVVTKRIYNTYSWPYEKKKAIITVFRPRSSPVAAAIRRPVVIMTYPPQVAVARAAPKFAEIRK